MKRIIAIALAALLIAMLLIPMASATTVSATSSDESGELVERTVVFYDLQELQDDPTILENRTPDTIIVERCIGVVIDDSTGEGKLIYDDPVYNYIWYSPERFSNWDVVVTYNIYNPATQYTDDVLYRLDFKVGNLKDLY